MTTHDDIRSGAASPAPTPNGEELLETPYRVDPEAFWEIAQMRGDDGYDRIELAGRRGWHAVPSWGRDGWDLGSWPLVVIFHRRSDVGYELAYNVEGDITVYRYATRELLDTATDYLAFWHWKHEDESWVAGVDSVEVAPAHLRGPFSWARLHGSEEVTS
jgi:hypothetical protein